MSKKIIDRQWPLYAVADLTIANMGAGNEVTASVPPNAVVVGVGLLTVTAFDSATTATGSIGDGTTTFVNAQDVKTTGLETAAVTAKYYPTGGTITFSLAETGATATVGHAIGYVSYVVVGRGNEIAE